jgi:uncharacterized protein (DUF1778 family)
MSRGNPPLPVRVSPDQRERWRTAAMREGVDLSTWVRRTLDAAAEAAGPRRVSPEASARALDLRQRTG